MYGYSPSEYSQANCDVQAQCPAIKSKDAATLVGMVNLSIKIKIKKLKKDTPKKTRFSHPLRNS